jgi:hypothetical protein
VGPRTDSHGQAEEEKIFSLPEIEAKFLNSPAYILVPTQNMFSWIPFLCVIYDLMV